MAKSRWMITAPHHDHFAGSCRVCAKGPAWLGDMLDVTDSLDTAANMNATCSIDLEAVQTTKV